MEIARQQSGERPENQPHQQRSDDDSDKAETQRRIGYEHPALLQGVRQLQGIGPAGYRSGKGKTYILHRNHQRQIKREIDDYAGDGDADRGFGVVIGIEGGGEYLGGERCGKTNGHARISP